MLNDNLRVNLNKIWNLIYFNAEQLVLNLIKVFNLIVWLVLNLINDFFHLKFR